MTHGGHQAEGAEWGPRMDLALPHPSPELGPPLPPKELSRGWGAALQGRCPATPQPLDGPRKCPGDCQRGHTWRPHPSAPGLSTEAPQTSGAGSFSEEAVLCPVGCLPSPAARTPHSDPVVTAETCPVSQCIRPVITEPQSGVFPQFWRLGAQDQGASVVISHCALAWRKGTRCSVGPLTGTNPISKAPSPPNTVILGVRFLFISFGHATRSAGS